MVLFVNFDIAGTFQNNREPMKIDFTFHRFLLVRKGCFDDDFHIARFPKFYIERFGDYSHLTILTNVIQSRTTKIYLNE